MHWLLVFADNNTYWTKTKIP